MSSGLAAPIPQIPRTGHDLFDADSWPARQLETAQARLQSCQAVLKNFSYNMTKFGTSNNAVQDKKVATTYPRPISVVGVANYETAIDAALVGVTTAILQLRTALNS
jgi:hypothetical protein